MLILIALVSLVVIIYRITTEDYDEDDDWFEDQAL